MAVWVGECGASERRSVIERIGVAISLHAQAGRLPHGLSSQENLINRSQEVIADGGARHRCDFQQTRLA
jgi:hypothetical protein